MPICPLIVDKMIFFTFESQTIRFRVTTQIEMRSFLMDLLRIICYSSRLIRSRRRFGGILTNRKKNCSHVDNDQVTLLLWPKQNVICVYVMIRPMAGS